MITKLQNPEYDEQAMQRISRDSHEFLTTTIGALDTVLEEGGSEKIWLGTLQIGLDGRPVQVQLVVTQVPDEFIDET